MALPVNGSAHLIAAYYSFYRPRKDERLSWPKEPYIRWRPRSPQWQFWGHFLAHCKYSEYPTCPWYSQSYSVDGGSDAAFYCQYCVNLLLWLLWPAELSWCYTFVWDWVLSAGERLNVCSGRMTCCTPDMETYLVNKTRWQFQGRVLTKMRKLHLLFANVTSVFDGMILNYSSEYMQLW